ncbi:N-hydroxyarylamine O-acetyltransferase [Planifilum fulgidum]|jgi:N-hydroxyarylamine O-acetyltransferase|uniref:N-hydroxyarylamine O-acetyltransferase n=1 Tax=Planifilum fulgidum TaxID=201973 RepID=A0A1I2NLA1_9BACL|nr:arylamine N-acetyltransferase [Planifilum fulgidum]MBO2497116.1 arylamine N-acetyltransferase [Bacillota bacterium]MBO2533475.1 arylamine N-acetyltransferase [Thermoactinomycetaceae bacterium]SFG04353.1 N-hydroxyarylamine O-acetyltransferase [Planifilum fulgidum]
MQTNVKPDVQAYLNLLDLAAPPKPTLAFLERLHERHLLRVPFENLNIHLKRPIRLDIPSLFDKIVRQKRGGFCYELNHLFHWLLRSLGYDSILVSARVKNERGGFNPEFDHLALIVTLDEPYLADVGFGNAFRRPLPISGEVREDIGGAYRVRRLSKGEYAMQRQSGESWSDAYRFTLVPRRIEDFMDMCRYHQTSPDSHFTRNRICSRATRTGRITLTDTALKVTEGGEQKTRPVTSEEEWFRLLERHFGIRP